MATEETERLAKEIKAVKTRLTELECSCDWKHPIGEMGRRDICSILCALVIVFGPMLLLLVLITGQQDVQDIQTSYALLAYLSPSETWFPDWVRPGGL